MMDAAEDLLPRVVDRLERFPDGTSFGRFRGRRYRVHVSRPLERIVKLYAEELGGNDVVSFNLYALQDAGETLKPCEMSSAKVIQFVLEFDPDAPQDV